VSLGLKDVLFVRRGVPPVAVAYQSTATCPAVIPLVGAVTESSGLANGLAQITLLIGFVGSSGRGLTWNRTAVLYRLEKPVLVSRAAAKYVYVPAAVLGDVNTKLAFVKAVVPLWVGYQSTVRAPAR
jgi:hypothetical protein